MKIVKPKRKKQSCIQTWNGSIEEMFPLLCPVREVDWAPGWEPSFVASNSGVVEQDCIFIVPGAPGDSIWLVSDYRPEEYSFEMLTVVPGFRLSKLAISLERERDNRTRAKAAYEHTALSDEGAKFVDSFTAESFNEFMANWKLAIDHYVATGEKIDVEQ